MEIMASIGYGVIFYCSLWLFLGEKGPLKAYSNSIPLLIAWFLSMSFLAYFTFY